MNDTLKQYQFTLAAGASKELISLKGNTVCAFQITGNGTLQVTVQADDRQAVPLKSGMFIRYGTSFKRLEVISLSNQQITVTLLIGDAQLGTVGTN